MQSDPVQTDRSPWCETSPPVLRVTSSIDGLPREILEMILSYVTPLHALVLARVCKRWNSLLGRRGDAYWRGWHVYGGGDLAADKWYVDVTELDTSAFSLPLPTNAFINGFVQRPKKLGPWCTSSRRWYWYTDTLNMRFWLPYAERRLRSPRTAVLRRVAWFFENVVALHRYCNKLEARLQVVRLRHLAAVALNASGAQPKVAASLLPMHCTCQTHWAYANPLARPGEDPVTFSRRYDCADDVRKHRDCFVRSICCTFPDPYVYTNRYLLRFEELRARKSKARPLLDIV